MNVGKLTPYFDTDTGRMVPLCRDCEHFHVRGERKLCTHASAVQTSGRRFDVVTGELFGSAAEVMRAPLTARNDPHACGPDGKNFEPVRAFALPPVRFDNGPGLFRTRSFYVVVVLALIVACVAHHCGGAS